MPESHLPPQHWLSAVQACVSETQVAAAHLLFSQRSPQQSVAEEQASLVAPQLLNTEVQVWLLGLQSPEQQSLPAVHCSSYALHPVGPPSLPAFALPPPLVAAPLPPWEESPPSLAPANPSAAPACPFDAPLRPELEPTPAPSPEPASPVPVPAEPSLRPPTDEPQAAAKTVTATNSAPTIRFLDIKPHLGRAFVGR